MSFKTQNLLLVYNAFGCLILDREWIFWTKNTHCISLLRELFPSSRAPLAWVSGSNETLYHQLGIFMLIPLWPLLVSYIRKQNTKFIGAVQGRWNQRSAKGPVFFQPEKNTGFTWEERIARCRGELQQVEETPTRFADTSTTHNSQLPELEMIRTIGSKHHFFAIKKPEKTATKQG